MAYFFFQKGLPKVQNDYVTYGAYLTIFLKTKFLLKKMVNVVYDHP